MKILITGISSGIGKEFANQAINQGHEVWGLARRKELLEELKKESGDKLKFSVCDIGNLDDMRQTASEMRKEDFVPDIVVLNAAVRSYDIDNFSFGLIKTSIETNINGSLFWVSEFLPDFLKRNSGTFVAISSTAALRPDKESISYPSTKSALDMTFRGLRLNYSKDNVKFITIRFGPIGTKMWKGNKSFLVAPPRKAARFISSAVNKKSGIYYFPFISTAIFRLTIFLPDKIFRFLSDIITKNR